MAYYTLSNPFQYWNSPANSNPVGLGKLYVGLQDLDPVTPANRVTVKALTADGSEITLSQPIQLLAGGIPSYNGSPVQLLIEEETVSVRVNSLAGAQVFYTPRWSAPVDAGALGEIGSTVLIAGVEASVVALNTKPAVFSNTTLFANNGLNVLVTSSFTLSSSITLTGSLEFKKGIKFTVPSGVTLTFANGCSVYAQDEYINNTGGTVVWQSGANEQKIVQSTPTAGWYYNNGYGGNTCLSTACYINGGTATFPNKIGSASELSVIGGSYDNVIGNNCSATTMAGGAHHIVADDCSHSAILGGAYQFSYAAYGVLGGGKDNKTYSTFGGVFSGQLNEAGDSSPGYVALDNRSAFVGGGSTNKAKALRSAIAGGFTNTITQPAQHSFIGAGLNNTVSAIYAFNGGGSANTVSGNGAVNLAGVGNTASGLASLTHGESNIASGNYAVAIGESNEAAGSSSVVTGRRAKASLFGQRSHGAGYFATKGDAQLSDLIARIQTVASQTIRMDLNGAVSNPITLPDNTAWLYEISIAAKSTDNTEYGAWRNVGMIKRAAGAASVALIGTPSTTVINAPSGWSYAVSANTTDGSLQISVSTSGAVTKTINWVASIKLTEVS